jgi:DNA-binding MarR family transcriptional regulator
MIEVSRSRGDRASLAAAIGTAIMRWQEATQLFDEAVGERLGLSTAERHCISALVEAPLPAGAIAEAVGLTPAAVTSLVDRLEARGFVERQRGEADRRQVLVALTEATKKAAQRYYGPIAREGAAMLEAMSLADLAAVQRFMTAALDLQQRQVDRIRTDKAKAPTGLQTTRKPVARS